MISKDVIYHEENIMNGYSYQIKISIRNIYIIEHFSFKSENLGFELTNIEEK